MRRTRNYASINRYVQFQIVLKRTIAKLDSSNLQIFLSHVHIQGNQKKLAHFLYALTSYALTSSNIDQCSNLCYCLNKENICNNIVTKDPTHLKCVATLPGEIAVS